MKHTRPLLTFATLAGLALCSTLTFAQDPGGQNSNGPRGGFQGPGGQRGGPGGFGGQMPMALGTITAGDQSGRLTIQSQFGNGTQTILVTTATKLVTQSVISVSDLKVNDQVQIQGVPTGITASSITAGQMPDFMPGGGQNRGGSGNPGGPGAAAGGQAAETTTGFASATGKVVSLSPLTISLGTDITMTVKLAADARITRITTTTFNKLKVGDRVMASGQAGADRVFAATGLAINMQMGGPGGQGGFGRGPGGQGGPGGGPGGQRGPGGGPGGNGGPGGPPPNGAGGPPPGGDPNGN